MICIERGNNYYTSISLDIHYFLSTSFIMSCTLICDISYTHTIFVSPGEDIHHTYIVISDQAPTDCQIITHLDHPHSKAHIDMVGIIHNDHKVSLDGQIIIGENGRQTSWHLQEEIVIIGNHSASFTKPILDVHHNQVSASHSAKIHAINPLQLFYLMSRWLDYHQAYYLLLEWILMNILNGQSEIHTQGILLTDYDHSAICSQIIALIKKDKIDQ